MGWLIGKRRTRGGCTSRKSTWRGNMRRACTVLALAVVALASVAYLSAPTQSLMPVARAADTSALTIIVPHPAGKHTYGPVGTNITVRADGLTPNSVYALGYATADAGGCLAGFQPFQNMNETAASDGTFTATITWPSDVNFVGVTYYICAQGTNQVVSVPTQSGETFRVDAANAPSVDVAAAPSTPTSTTPVPPPPDGSFYPGSAVTVTGQNFVPGSSTLVVAVSNGQLQNPGDFQSAAQNALSTSGGDTTITSRSSGDISATVKLPSSMKAGGYNLYVFSNDGSGQAMPSLVASKQITIAAAPTPQPTATTQPTATATTGASPTPGGTSSGQPHNLLGIILLSGLSILLFIAGVISLLSAASMPRPDRP